MLSGLVSLEELKTEYGSHFIGHKDDCGFQILEVFGIPSEDSKVSPYLGSTRTDALERYNMLRNYKIKRAQQENYDFNSQEGIAELIRRCIKIRFIQQKTKSNLFSSAYRAFLSELCRYIVVKERVESTRKDVLSTARDRINSEKVKITSKNRLVRLTDAEVDSIFLKYTEADIAANNPEGWKSIPQIFGLAASNFVYIPLVGDPLIYKVVGKPEKFCKITHVEIVFRRDRPAFRVTAEKYTEGTPDSVVVELPSIVYVNRPKETLLSQSTVHAGTGIYYIYDPLAKLPKDTKPKWKTVSTHVSHSFSGAHGFSGTAVEVQEPNLKSEAAILLSNAGAEGEKLSASARILILMGTDESYSKTTPEIIAINSASTVLRSYTIGSVRKALKQLRDSGFVRKTDSRTHQITPQGMRAAATAANKLRKPKKN